VVVSGGERGKVVEIGMRSTRILTLDDIEIVVPNSAIASGMIVNESGGPSKARRIRIQVGVAYGSDVDQVRAVLLRLAEAEPLACRQPEPRVRFRKFGDSSLDFELLVWIEHPAQRGLVSDKLNTAVYKAFQAEGVQIPFPQRDVHVIPQGPGAATPGGSADPGGK
jgi:small-conductance mechanosensitive channel